MRLRRAVAKIPAKSSVPPGSPLNKPRSLSTHSESTLPQTLIPLDFISFISNVYRKPGVGLSVLAQKFVNSSLAPPRSRAHARTRATPFRSYIYFITREHPGDGVSLRWDSQSWLSFLGLSQVTEHGPPGTPQWFPRTVARRPAKCQNHASCSRHRRQETYPLWAVSKVLRADIGSAMPECRPGRKSIPKRRKGIALARRPGSNVLRFTSNVDLTAGRSG